MEALFPEAASQFLRSSHWLKFGLMINPTPTPMAFWMPDADWLHLGMRSPKYRPHSVPGAMEME